MSEHGSLTGNDTWYGTQMKPEVFEPFTAEWAGRLVHDADWLFQRQNRLIYSDGYDTQYYLQRTEFSWALAEWRFFWLPEVFGTITWAVLLTNPTDGQDRADETVFAATLQLLCKGVTYDLAVTPAATWSTPSGGEATYWRMKMTPDPDWNAGTVYPGTSNRFGYLRIQAALKADFGAGNPHWIFLQNMALIGEARS